MNPDGDARMFFVTGTDTGVGKTVIACGLLAAAASRGLRTLGLKPVAAGHEDERSGEPYNADVIALRAAATAQINYADINPVLLERPIAPHIAAAGEGIDMRAADLVEHCRQVCLDDVDFVVVEGAGGWLVPINDEETLADFCVQLEVPVILVVGMRLGCLNHGLLTAGAIEQAGLKLAGWVANCVDPNMDEIDANIESLRCRLPAPYLGRVPHTKSSGVPENIAVHLDITALIND